jgi:hypothetical protein
MRAFALRRRANRHLRFPRQLLQPGGEEARRYVRAGFGDQPTRLRVRQVAGEVAGRDGVVRVAPAAVQVERYLDVALGAAVLVVDHNVLRDVD